jgi:hypothetical protein
MDSNLSRFITGMVLSERDLKAHRNVSAKWVPSLCDSLRARADHVWLVDE